MKNSLNLSENSTKNKNFTSNLSNHKLKAWVLSGLRVHCNHQKLEELFPDSRAKNIWEKEPEFDRF